MININALRTFISRLSFIPKRTTYAYYAELELKIINIDNETNKITGIAITRSDTVESKIISFETQISESSDILIFKSKYQLDNYKESQNLIGEEECVVKNESKTFEALDTFVIIEQPKTNFYTPKTKYLIHLVDGKIEDVYTVSKKYIFETGLSENFMRLNTNNKDILNSINNIYNDKIRKTR